jgi:hypothetical protein
VSSSSGVGDRKDAAAVWQEDFMNELDDLLNASGEEEEDAGEEVGEARGTKRARDDAVLAPPRAPPERAAPEPAESYAHPMFFGGLCGVCGVKEARLFNL